MRTMYKPIKSRPLFNSAFNNSVDEFELGVTLEEFKSVYNTIGKQDNQRSPDIKKGTCFS